MRWEVRLLDDTQKPVCSIWLGEFDFASIAALHWLQGHEFARILPIIQSSVLKEPHLEPRE
jgi:hypothetical protein